MTTPTSDPALSRRLVSLLRENGDVDTHCEVFYFGDPDHCNPLNEFAKMSAETIRGLKRKWKVQLSIANRRMTYDQIQEELLAKLVEETNAKPKGEDPI